MRWQDDSVYRKKGCNVLLLSTQRAPAYVSDSQSCYQLKATHKPCAFKVMMQHRR